MVPFLSVFVPKDPEVPQNKEVVSTRPGPASLGVVLARFPT